MASNPADDSSWTWLLTARRQELVRARDEARAGLEHASSPADERLAYQADLRIRVLDDVAAYRSRLPNEDDARAWLRERIGHASSEELRALEDEFHRTAKDTFAEGTANWLSHQLDARQDSFDRLGPEEFQGLDRESLQGHAQALTERLAGGPYLGRSEDAARLTAVVHEQLSHGRADAQQWVASMTADHLAAELQALQDKLEFGQATPAELDRLSHASEILHERQLEAITSWVNGMPADQLRVVIDDLERHGELGSDPLAGEKLFWAQSELWGREHGNKGLDTLVIDAGGRIGTIRELATEAARAHAQGSLDALTGNFVSALTFHVSGDPHLAAMLGGFFDAGAGVAQGRAEFRAVRGLTPHDTLEPLSQRHTPDRTPGDDTPGARSEPFRPPDRPATDWNALREAVDVPQPRQSDNGFRTQQVREGDYSVIRIEGPVGSAPDGRTASAYGFWLEGEHGTHGVGRQLGENSGPSSMGSGPATFNLSQMKVFENLLRSTADAAAPYGGVVETVTYLKIEHRTVNGVEVQVLVGVDRSASLRLAGSDTLYPVGRLAAEIDPVTREARAVDDAFSPVGWPITVSEVPAGADEPAALPWMSALRELVRFAIPGHEPTPSTPMEWAPKLPVDGNSRAGDDTGDSAAGGQTAEGPDASMATAPTSNSNDPAGAAVIDETGAPAFDMVADAASRQVDFEAQARERVRSEADSDGDGEPDTTEAATNNSPTAPASDGTRAVDTDGDGEPDTTEAATNNSPTAPTPPAITEASVIAAQPAHDLAHMKVEQVADQSKLQAVEPAEKAEQDGRHASDQAQSQAHQQADVGGTGSNGGAADDDIAILSRPHSPHTGSSAAHHGVPDRSPGDVPDEEDLAEEKERKLRDAAYLSPVNWVLWAMEQARGASADSQVDWEAVREVLRDMSAEDLRDALIGNVDALDRLPADLTELRDGLGDGCDATTPDTGKPPVDTTPDTASGPAADELPAPATYDDGYSTQFEPDAFQPAADELPAPPTYDDGYSTQFEPDAFQPAADELPAPPTYDDGYSTQFEPDAFQPAADELPAPPTYDDGYSTQLEPDAFQPAADELPAPPTYDDGYSTQFEPDAFQPAADELPAPPTYDDGYSTQFEPDAFQPAADELPAPPTYDDGYSTQFEPDTYELAAEQDVVVPPQSE